ncbi:MAG: MFS transporter [Anaerolineae bacterium]|nr:MFS transporter [Anaerolineae bacterium]
MKHYTTRLSGMQKFTLIWFGELISLFGTAGTRFALMIWAYEQTQQATTLALLGFFSFILYIALSPLAGVVVDRVDRRLVMIAGDLAVGLMTVIMLVLYATGGLQIWHLYLGEALTGAAEAFQLPAYSAATTTLVPRHQYARANGMRSLAFSASRVFGPFFAGIALPRIGISGVMLVDIVTFLAAVGMLAVIPVPRPVVTHESERSQGSIWRDMSYGWRYIRARRGLFGLLLIYTGINLAGALTYSAILAPMILARTSGDELSLGIVQAAMGVGGVLGGLILSIWGGPKRQIHGVLLFGAISFLGGDFLMAIWRTVPAWVFGISFSTIFVPFIFGCMRAIWQAKVAPAAQGRVFSVQSMFQEFSLPVGYLLAGPLADRVFEPAMLPEGSLAGIFGGLVGTGPGAGMALMFVGTAILGSVICLSGYLFPAVRHVERDLPDYEPIPQETSTVIEVEPAL